MILPSAYGTVDLGEKSKCYRSACKVGCRGEEITTQCQKIYPYMLQSRAFLQYKATDMVAGSGFKLKGIGIPTEIWRMSSGVSKKCTKS
jgi:hypothetical protein